MAAVSAELGRLAPEPMPADLAARLDALLAEPAGSVGLASGTAAVAEESPVPAPPAPLALVHDADASGDGARGVRRTTRRLRWATPIAVAAGAVAFAGFGLDYIAARSDSSSDSSNSSAAGLQNSPLAATGGVQILATGTDYTGATLGGSPEAQVFSASQPSAVQPNATEPNVPSQERKDTVAPDRAAAGDPLARLRPQSVLQQCLDAIAAENAAGQISTLSVDYARFDGTAAVVVRFTADNGSWAWASGAACGTPGGGAATLDKVPVR
jgi:hypothetical protein